MIDCLQLFFEESREPVCNALVCRWGWSQSKKLLQERVAEYRGRLVRELDHLQFLNKVTDALDFFKSDRILW